MSDASRQWRFKAVEISRDLLVEMIKTGTTTTTGPRYAVCEQGVPQDAEFVYLATDNGHLRFIFAHPEWPALESNAEIPLIDMIFAQTTAPQAHILKWPQP